MLGDVLCTAGACLEAPADRTQSALNPTAPGVGGQFRTVRLQHMVWGSPFVAHLSGVKSPGQWRLRFPGLIRGVLWCPIPV